MMIRRHEHDTANSPHIAVHKRHSMTIRRGLMPDPSLALGLTLTLCFGLALGCRVRRDNPEHCFHAQGDSTCLERFPDGSLPFCASESCGDAPYGCVAELPEPDCYSPCGADTLLGEGECEVAEGDSTSDTGETTDESTGEPPDLPPGPECELDSDCLDHEGTPFCIGGACESCSSLPDPGLGCAMLNPDLPVCHADECVACFGDDQEVCKAQSLFCLPDTTLCGPCTNHDQCPGQAACDILEGLCFPENEVWHVDGDGGADFTTLAETLEYVAPGQGRDFVTFILHERDGGVAYSGMLHALAATDQTLALIAAPGEAPLTTSQSIKAGVVANGDSKIYVRGVEVEGQGAIDVTGSGTVYVENSEFYVSVGPAVELSQGGKLILRNSMLRGGFTDVRLVVTTSSSSFDIVYSTLLGLGDGLLDCSGLPKLSTLRNSVLVGPEGSPLSTCSPISVDLQGNALSEAVASEPNNTVIGGLQSEWFADGGLYDLHLTDQVPLALTTAATWIDGDPMTDIDGDPRPVGPDTTDWAGADVPAP